MNLWTMIVLIVAIGVIGDIIKALSNSKNTPVETDKNSSMSISHLKTRIENLETIVLERDRKSRFAGVD